MGAAAGLMGLGMLVLGRRNGVLFNPLLALFASFAMVVAGVLLAGRGKARFSCSPCGSPSL